MNASGATSFVNNGVLDLISGAAQLPANFTNGAGGIVLTPGNVKARSATKTGTTFSVLVDSYTGHTFRLQRATNLSQAFANIGVPQAGTTGTPLTFTDSSASGARGFYRITAD